MHIHPALPSAKHAHIGRCVSSSACARACVRASKQVGLYACLPMHATCQFMHASPCTPTHPCQPMHANPFMPFMPTHACQPMHANPSMPTPCIPPCLSNPCTTRTPSLLQTAASCDGRCGVTVTHSMPSRCPLCSMHAQSSTADQLDAFQTRTESLLLT